MERFFKNPHTLLSKRESPLGRYIDEFAQQLCEQGYSDSTRVGDCSLSLNLANG